MPTPQQQINYGNVPNDGQGDPLRTAFVKVDDNFDAIWNAGPVGSNVTIVNSTIATVNTNGNLVLKPNGIGIVQVNSSMVPDSANLRDLGTADRRWRRIYLQSFNTANLEVQGDLSVSGNLTIQGDTIQIGNLITDARTLQLANTAITPEQANGAGITVGANDDTATLLYDSDSNAWVTNIGITTAANISAGYFLGNGSQLTGLPEGYGNTDVELLMDSGVAANIIPAANAVYSLGNATNYWSNLWVSNNTIYIGGVPLGVTGNVLTVNGEPVLSNDSNSSITTTGNITADYFFGNGSQLTGIDVSTGDITFSDTTISAPNDATIRVEAKNDDGIVTAKLTLDSDDRIAKLESSTTDNQSFFEGGDYTTAVWTVNQFSDNVLVITGAQVIYDFLEAQNTSWDRGNNETFSWNNDDQRVEYTGYSWDDQAQELTLTVGPGYPPPTDPTAVISITFDWLITSRISVDSYDNEAVEIRGRGIPVEIETDQRFDVDADGIRLYSREDDESYIRLYAGEYVRIRTNNYLDSPGSYEWQFNNDGTLEAPGDVSVAGNITANYFIGDGSLLTGLPESYSDANVAAYLPTYGGNILVDRVIGNTANNLGYIQWQGNSSGDNNGYTTLRLVPDDTLVDNDQYLIIDPTDPYHIHIRAGGTQDSSQAELYLGGEANYVRVTDGSGVRLQNQTRNDTTYYYSDPGTFTNGSWYESGGTYFVQYTTADSELINVSFEFNDDNENTLLVYYNGGNDSAELTSAGSVSNLGGGVYRVSVNEEPPASPTAITAFEYTIWNNRTNRIELSSNDFTVSVTDDIRITGRDTFSLRNESPSDPIEIITDYDGAERTWEFAANGTLTTPGDITVSGDITGTSGASTLVLKAQPDSNTAIQLNNSVGSEIRTVANLEIRTDSSDTDQIWTFDTSGNLTTPGNINFGGDASAAPSLNDFASITSAANFAVVIDSADSAAAWSFETGDGALGEFDESPVLRTPAGNGSVIYNETQLAMLAGNIDAGERSSVRLEDGGVSLLGTTSLDGELSTIIFEVNTGGVGIRALGDAAPRLNVVGNITGGNINTGGQISATGNLSANNVSTGNVVATRLQNDANLVLRSNVAGTLRNWTFDVLGDLNLPFGGNIVGSGGVIANTGTFTGNVTAANFEGNISITGNITGTSANVDLVAGSFTSTFDNTGNVALPGNVSAAGDVTATGDVTGKVLISTNSVGNEGGEIHLAASANATITNGVIIDSYNDIVRIFEGGGTARGVQIDLAKAPPSAGGELLWKVSDLVDAGTFVTLDNLKATVPTTGNRGLSIAAVSGSFSANIGAWYGGSGGVGGDSVNNLSVTTTPSGSLFSWNFVAEGNSAQYTIYDKTNNRMYRVTLMIGPAYLDNFISIERLA